MGRQWGILLGLLVACQAASPDKPQGHKGLVNAYKPGPPSVKLSKGDLDKLRTGTAVRQQLSSGTGGRGVVVQDVHAPPEVVWDRILDFPAYTKMVPKVSACENYKVVDHKLEGMKEIFTRMRLTVMGFSVEYYIQHKYYPRLNSLVWTLDYDRESDLDDSVGYWHVTPHPDPDREHWSRVYYSIDMRLKSWMPGFVKNALKNQALGQATSWVKKESEKIGVPKHLQRKVPQNVFAAGDRLEKVEVGKSGFCRKLAEARDNLFRPFAKLARPGPKCGSAGAGAA